MQVLKHSDFRNLFFGQAASTVGDQIVFVALALYVTEIGLPSDVGLVLAAHALPLVGFVLLGGVWADRLPRAQVMISTDLVRFALHALLAALIFTGAVEVWHIVVIEALFGTAEAFFRPALTGLVPQTVPEDEIQPARAATSTIETVAAFVGPALATALVLPLGYLISGPLGEALGGREVLTVGAAVSIAVLASALLVRETWTLRRLETNPVGA